jgi:hypothetical protein
MSDAGRDRVSLGVGVWQSSHELSAQRSAVRSIAWLYLCISTSLPPDEQTRPKQDNPSHAGDDDTVTQGHRVVNLISVVGGLCLAAKRQAVSEENEGSTDNKN